MSGQPQPRETRMVWEHPLVDFLHDRTRYLDLEGAFRSGKTTAALWKVLEHCRAHPGAQWLVCRYFDDETQSKLKPVWRQVLAAAGITPTWEPTEHCDILPTTPPSRVYLFGLKSSDTLSRYAKLRGMTLAGVYVDQAEELPEDLFVELKGRLSQPGIPQQLILTPNPPDETQHWISRHFPETNHVRDHQMYSVSLYVNAANLPTETIAALETAYPPSHPRHRPFLMGRRGLSVTGRPVYGGDAELGIAGAFDRARHVRPLALQPLVPLCEAIDYGKHHPCLIWGQFTPYGQLHVLGGILGENIYLEDFIPIVRHYRQLWFPAATMIETCGDPAGAHDSSQGLRQNGVALLRDYGMAVRYQVDSNAPDVREALIQRIASYMRRHTPAGEAFAVNAAPRWLAVGLQSVRPQPFIADALEAGYVWDEHMVSVGSKQIRRPKKDGLYEHGMNCLEYLEHNFGGAQPSLAQRVRQAERQTGVALRRAQQDRGESFRWDRPSGAGLEAGRGGYR